MHIGPRGTGPLNPDFVRTVVGSTSENGGTPGPNTAPPDPVGLPETHEPQIENQTRTYQTTPLSGDDLQFPTANALDDSSTIVQEAEELSADLSLIFADPEHELNPASQERLNTLAKDLGFRDLNMMKHHLRNLTPAQQQVLLEGLKQPTAEGSDAQTHVKQEFEAVFRQSIDNLFTSQGLPTPTFRSESNDHGVSSENLWDTASLASVYNGLETIRQASPERLASITKGGGISNQTGKQEGLNFVRRHTPSVHNPDAFLEALSEATKVAHADTHSGDVYLYDAAVSGDHSLISDRIVDKLDLLTRNIEDANGGKQLSPLYTDQEITARGLDQREDETNQAYAQRLRGSLSNEFVGRFGGWENLQKAVNFTIRFRAIESNGIPKATVPETGEDARQATIEALQSLGPSHLRQIICRMEQQDGVQQMQEFLHDNAPPGTATSELVADGLIGPRTHEVTMSFQTSMALNTFKERIEDDPNLPETQKIELVEFINDEFRTLADHPDQNNQIMDRVAHRLTPLISENPPVIAEHTRDFLQQDLHNLSQLRTGNFDRATADNLVSNWFNVMDSGQGNDLAEQLVVHELSHIWEEELDQETNLRVSENWGRLFESNHGDEDYSTSSMSTHAAHEHLHSDQASASNYGATNAEEDFAEASRVFTYDPQRLMRRSLMKFMFMNTLNNGQYNANQIMEMAKESGYSEEDVLSRLNTITGYGDNGIQFTLPMAEKMRETYEPLRTILEPEPISEQINFSPVTSSIDFSALTLTKPSLSSNFGTNPLGSEGSSLLNFPQLELPDLFAEEDVYTPQTNESGWVMNAVSEHTQNLFQTYISSDRMGQRMRTLDQIAQFEENFVNQGPIALNRVGKSVPQEAAMALDQAISDKFCNGQPPTQADRQRGYAIMAALSIYQATGSFEPSAHAAIQEHLPESFHMMLNHPSMQQILSPENIGKYNQSALFEEVLGEVVAMSQRQNQIDGKINAMKTTSNGVNAALSEMLGDEAGAYTSLSSTTTRVNELLDTPQVQALFTQNDIFMQMGVTAANAAVRSMRATTGIAFPDISVQDFQRMLLTAILMGSDKSPTDFSGFVGEYIQANVDSDLIG